MSIYTKPILELIVKRPGIRAVEIADQVDCDTDMVQPAIQAEIDAGRIVVHDVTAPNSRPAKAYVPSPDLVKEYSGHAVETKPAMPTNVLEQLTKVGEKELTATTREGKTKTARAMEYLQIHGSADNAKMREVLDIGEKANPRAYLLNKLKKGTVAFDGKTWTLGNGTPAADVSNRRAESHAPVAPVSAVDEEQTEQEASNEAQFACALWSDGDLQLVRDGEVVGILSKTETEILRRYLNRFPSLEAA
ncbi:MAG TPA: hypothetical protein VGE12_00355 [Noviherbaspirillum sp.]